MKPNDVSDVLPTVADLAAAKLPEGSKMKRDLQASRQSSKPSRRDFLKCSGTLAAGSALVGVAIPHVHAAENNTLQLALIGCGGRGSGAVANAFEAPGGPVKLVALADIVERRVRGAQKSLSPKYPDKVDVPPERQFVGFDAYRKAMDCLRPGDIAVLGTNPAFRVPHLDYAVEKGLHVFMEKSFATDPVGVRRIIKAGREATKKNLKIAAGLMCRHSVARQELIRRIRDGQLGQIQLIRAYRMHGDRPLGKTLPDEHELLYQVRNSVHFLWVSGGLFAEMTIHQIDEVCWLKDAYPISAHGMGGRIPDSTDKGQNLDTFAIEYTFADGTKALVNGRYISNCFQEFATFVHGTRSAAQFSGNIHAATVQTYKDQRILPGNTTWTAEKEPFSPWQAEWNVLMDAVRNDKPHNEAERAALSNLADMMGRAAIHRGQVVTWEEAMTSNFQWCPNVDTMSLDTPLPVQADARGHYPVPVAGKWTGF